MNYWKELQGLGLNPWNWITQVPLHQSNINWQHAPIIVFNENTPEYEQFEIGCLSSMIRFNKVLADATEYGEYDEDRQNWQFTAGNKCGKCTTDQCPLSKVMCPAQTYSAEWNQEGQVLTCLAYLCNSFQAGDVLPMVKMIRQRPDLAIRRLFFAMGEANYFDAISVVVYLRRFWLQTRDKGHQKQRLARETTQQQREAEDPPNSAHFDVHNCPYLDQVCVISKGVPMELELTPGKIDTKYIRSLVIAIQRKSVTDAWSNMMAVHQMQYLPSLYLDSIPPYLKFHEPNYDPHSRGFWEHFCEPKVHPFLNSFLGSRTLSSHKAIDVTGPWMPVMLDLIDYFDLNILQQYELHACSLLEATPHQMALIGKAWLANKQLPNRTGKNGESLVASPPLY